MAHLLHEKDRASRLVTLLANQGGFRNLRAPIAFARGWWLGCPGRRAIRVEEACAVVCNDAKIDPTPGLPPRACPGERAPLPPAARRWPIFFSPPTREANRADAVKSSAVVPQILSNFPWCDPYCLHCPLQLRRFKPESLRPLL